MKEEEKNLSLLKPNHFSKDDVNNPKNIDAEKQLEEARRKHQEEIVNKRVVIKNNDKK